MPESLLKMPDNDVGACWRLLTVVVVVGMAVAPPAGFKIVGSWVIITIKLTTLVYAWRRKSRCVMATWNFLDRGGRVVRARVLMKCETFWQLFCPPRPSSIVDVWWCGVHSFVHPICVRGPSNKSVNPPED